MLACSECVTEYANSKVKYCRQCQALVCTGPGTKQCWENKVHHCQAGDAFRITRMADFVQEQSRIQWLVEGLLPNRGWTLLHGTMGFGKTTFALQLCEALHEGLPFLGRETVQTPILYVQADSEAVEWQAIIARIAPSCKAWTLINAPERALGNPRYIDVMHGFIQRVKPGFVVFDSLYNLCSTPTKINSPEVLLDVQMLKVITQGIPWMLIHHPTKETNRASGHNSLEANPSNVWSLLQDRLVIQKGRLHGTREIVMVRDDTNGMWHLHPSHLRPQPAQMSQRTGSSQGRRSEGNGEVSLFTHRIV